MFAVENPVASFYARFSARARKSERNARTPDDTARAQEPQDLICAALADMVPSTAGEIAEASGLTPAVAQECLDRLAARYRVMFNPLTKRYSLPKVWRRAGNHVGNGAESRAGGLAA